MPKGKKKTKKKGEKAKSQPLPKPQLAKVRLEDGMKAYIGAYIDSYMDHVEDLNLTEEDFPLPYICYPFYVIGYILADNSTCILFRGYADAITIDVKKADFEGVDNEIAKGKYDYIRCYPPSHLYNQEDAKKEAKKDVELDIENIRRINKEGVERAARNGVLRSITLLNVVVPWVNARKTEQVDKQTPLQTKAAKFELADVSVKNGEDFSAYSERLKDMETAIFQVPEEELLLRDLKKRARAPPEHADILLPDEKPGGDVLPPKEITVDDVLLPDEKPEGDVLPPKEITVDDILLPDEKPAGDVTLPKEKPADEAVIIPVPAPPAKKKVPSSAQIHTSGVGPSGTNISIEIKQPEAMVGEVSESKRDIDVLRLKKTLYNQARGFKKVEREVGEINKKLVNLEQMRQTVFRMNRKVHDVEAKMSQVEQSNMDLIHNIEKMRTQQIEENKKMRRFITEKAKKARNQALTVAIILSLISLPFVVMLVITFWNDIKGMIGF